MTRHDRGHVVADASILRAVTSERIGPGRLQLVVCTGDDLVSHDLPEAGVVTIGRAEGNDVRVDHPSVSRRHALLHVGPPLRIEDLGGANGTFVRDPLEPPDPTQTRGLRRVSREVADIAPGDSFVLGSTLLVVRRPAIEPSAPGDIVVRDPAMRTLYEQAALAANAPISVLLLGETGVGKEILAHAVHQGSGRAARPFLGLNCAALAESLLEAELFGHEKGSFTGAAQGRPGLFEAAQGGTVFLDEVGELTLAIQAKLLRVLETREVLRVGGRAPRRIDARFIAATNRDLEAQVARGAFRQDLYFRLNGITLLIPPLRDRRSEIEPLAERFLSLSCEQLERAKPTRISGPARDLLVAYSWPGNVRELRNVVERAVVLSSGDEILPAHLPEKVRAAREPTAAVPEDQPADAVPEADDAMSRLRKEMIELERRSILDALDKCGGNQTQAAQLLGISRRTMVTRLGEFGIPRPRKKP